MPIDQDALDRLRRLRRLGVRRGARELARPEQVRPAPPEFTLPGEAVDTPHGPAWVRTVRYPLDGRSDFAELLGASSQACAALAREPQMVRLKFERAAFIDTETTGLSLGTGTYTFLIGIGTFEPLDRPEPAGEGQDMPAAHGLRPDSCFVVRQFFMRSPAEERAQLHLVEEALSACTGIVSFNGRAFDLPLIHNRFTLAYLPPPLPGAPHLDLLPPARRIWRARFGSCSLGDLERNVLGLQRTAADVPGWMIPGIYRDFYQGSARPETVALMNRVFYHNLEDITSMVLLAARMAAFFEQDRLPAMLAQVHPLECASLARCYQAVEWHEVGEIAYRTALAGALPDETRREILHDLAQFLKRAGRRMEAAGLWEEWITSYGAEDLTGYVELAKHHEWQTGDLVAARGWAAWAVRIVEGWPPGHLREETLIELQHRLQRIERKAAEVRSSPG